MLCPHIQCYVYLYNEVTESKSRTTYRLYLPELCIMFREHKSDGHILQYSHSDKSSPLINQPNKSIGETRSKYKRG